jgi:hypothetical protein
VRDVCDRTVAHSCAGAGHGGTDPSVRAGSVCATSVRAIAGLRADGFSDGGLVAEAVEGGWEAGAGGAEVSAGAAGEAGELPEVGIDDRDRQLQMVGAK